MINCILPIPCNTELYKLITTKFVQKILTLRTEKRPFLFTPHFVFKSNTCKKGLPQNSNQAQYIVYQQEIVIHILCLKPFFQQPLVCSVFNYSCIYSILHTAFFQPHFSVYFLSHIHEKRPDSVLFSVLQTLLLYQQQFPL